MNNHMIITPEISHVISEIERLETKLLRLKTDSDYAMLNSVDVAISEMEKQIIDLKKNLIKVQFNRKVTTVCKPNKTLYMVTVSENGKRKQISSTSIDGLYEKLAGTPISSVCRYPKDITMQEVFEQYSEYNHRPVIEWDGTITYPTSTASRKDQYWNKYWKGSYLSTMPVAIVSKGDIIDAIKRLTISRKYDIRQISQAKGIIKMVFDFAIWQKLIEGDNPVKDIPISMCPKKRRSTRRSATDKTWRNKLEEYILSLPKQDTYTLAIRFWLTLIQRVGEWLAIRWDDIDFDEGILQISHALCKREINGKLVVKDEDHLKKDEAVRNIPLTEKQIDILKELYLINGNKQYVFNSNGELPISTNRLNAKIHDYCKKIGIEAMSTHSQRRGGIQDAYNLNLPEDEIRVTAGHTDLGMTRQYNKQNSQTFSKEEAEKLFG